MRLITALSAGLLFAFPAQAETLTGIAAIVDGDTIDVGETRVRLYGIDAPEAGQKCGKATGGTWPCGTEATKAVAALAESQQVECDISGKDDYGRLIGVCRVGDTDINAAMVSGGHAWAFVKYASDYVGEEELARSARLGVWQGPAKAPWAYRAERWEVAKQDAPEGCPIKGNISSSGRIYHPPWSPWYSRTKINTAKGERWFCSEDEAVEAGWRAPKWR